MMTETFWKPEPRPPFEDWRTYSMLIPVLSSALGACLFLALGFSFTEIAEIPQRIRTGLVIVASFTVAFGSTFGSVGSGIEIFRKVHTAQAGRWDWVSLVISTCTTIAGFGMGFAALLGATAQWSAVAVIYGSLVVGTLAALDSSGDMIELGGLFGSFEDRKEQWLIEREQWRRENGQAVVTDRAELDQRLQFLVDRIKAVDQELDRVHEHVGQLDQRWSWPQSKKSDFETILAGMNGNAPKLDRESAILLLAQNQLQPPSDSTLAKWIREVQK